MKNSFVWSENVKITQTFQAKFGITEFVRSMIDITTDFSPTSRLSRIAMGDDEPSETHHHHDYVQNTLSPLSPLSAPQLLLQSMLS